MLKGPISHRTYLKGPVMGVRLNAPYNIAYGMGLKNGKEHPDWNAQDIEKSAALTAMALVVGGRANTAARRYFRELAHVYIVAAEQGQTGTLLPEDEWIKRYNHPWEIYHLMQMDKFDSHKKLQEIREARQPIKGQ